MRHRKGFSSPSAAFTIASVVLPRLIRKIFCGLGFLIAGMSAALGQAPAGTTIEDFRVSEKSVDGNRTTLLTGGQAVFREDGLLSLSDPRLVSVTAEGRTNLVFHASECLYNQDTKEISSVGQLNLSTSDGQMQLSGIGFSGNLTGPTLTVTDKVQARLNKKLRGVPLGQATQQGGVGDQRADIIQIASKQFDLQPGQAEFSESVTVGDANGTLKCSIISVELREDDWDLQSIKAQGGVAVESAQFKTTSEQAVYDLGGGTVLFQGNPRWEMDERSGRADQLLIHQESRVVSAQGHVSMTLPGGAGTEGDLFQFAPSRTGGNKSSSAVLEVQARSFVFQPASETKMGYARYIGSVQLSRGDNRLECHYLNIKLGVEKEDGVSMATAIGAELMQGENRLSSQLAVYDFKSGEIRLNMEPTWKLGEQSGRADRVDITPDRGRFRAVGNVKMKLPKQSGGIGFLFPEREKENGDETGAPLLVDCESFEYHQATIGGEADRAIFQGNVRLANETGFNVRANSIALGIHSVKNELESLVATGALNGKTAGQNSMRFIGNRLVYDRDTDTVRLTGEPSVEIHTTQDGADVVALGQAAQYSVGNGQLRLTGNPVLRTPEGELRGNEVVYDQQARRLRASGRWKMILNAKMIRQMQQSPETPEKSQP